MLDDCKTIKQLNYFFPIFIFRKLNCLLLMRLKLPLFLTLLPVLFACNQDNAGRLTPGLVISENGRYIATEDGDPFFWMGDTGWLLFQKMRREEGIKYCDNRKQKGFNGIQV